MTDRRRNISRYRMAQGVEGESEPGSQGRVLRNSLGLRSVSAIEQAETLSLLQAQERYLQIITTETVFTGELICQMHRDWLGGIYAWAGSYRTVELAKAGFRWPPARLVAQNMQYIERETLRRCTPCRPGSTTGVGEQMAEVQAELLMVHPFWEGNGRLARWVCDLMAVQAGLPMPDYGFRGRGAKESRERYLAAVVCGYRKDYAALVRFLIEALGRVLPDRG